MKIALFVMASVILGGCQTAAIKSQSDAMANAHIKPYPSLEMSMATVDMTEFAHRH